MPGTPFHVLQDRALPVHVTMMQWCPATDLIAIVTADNQIMIHRLSWQKLYFIGEIPSLVTSFAWHPDGRAFAAGHESGGVSVHVTEGGQLIRHTAYNDCKVSAMTWTKLEKPDVDVPYMTSSSPEAPNARASSHSGSDMLMLLDQGTFVEGHGLLATCDASGTIVLHAYGLIPIVRVRLDAIGCSSESLQAMTSGPGKIDPLRIAMGSKLDRLCVLGSLEGSDLLYSLNTERLQSLMIPILCVAKEIAVLERVFIGLSSTLRLCVEQWKSITSALTETHQSISDCLQMSGVSIDVVGALCGVLAAGTPKSGLAHFFSKLSGEGVQRLRKTILEAGKNVQKILRTTFRQGVEHLVRRASALEGLVRSHSVYRRVLPIASVLESLVNGAAALLYKTEEACSSVDSALQLWTHMLAWFDEIVMRLDEDMYHDKPRRKFVITQVIEALRMTFSPFSNPEYDTTPSTGHLIDRNGFGGRVDGAEGEEMDESTPGGTTYQKPWASRPDLYFRSGPMKVPPKREPMFCEALSSDLYTEEFSTRSLLQQFLQAQTKFGELRESVTKSVTSELHVCQPRTSNVESPLSGHRMECTPHGGDETSDMRTATSEPTALDGRRWVVNPSKRSSQAVLSSGPLLLRPRASAPARSPSPIPAIDSPHTPRSSDSVPSCQSPRSPSMRPMAAIHAGLTRVETFSLEQCRKLGLEKNFCQVLTFSAGKRLWIACFSSYPSHMGGTCRAWELELKSHPLSVELYRPGEICVLLSVSSNSTPTSNLDAQLPLRPSSPGPVSTRALSPRAHTPLSIRARSPTAVSPSAMRTSVGSVADSPVVFTNRMDDSGVFEGCGADAPDETRRRSRCQPTAAEEVEFAIIKYHELEAGTVDLPAESISESQSLVELFSSASLPIHCMSNLDPSQARVRSMMLKRPRGIALSGTRGVAAVYSQVRRVTLLDVEDDEGGDDDDDDDDDD
eukprot:Rmarinus@m.15026